jgi:hypothetical protein
MTREEMELLADIVVNKLLEKQKEYDEQFKKELEAMQNEFKDYGNIVIQSDQDAINESKESLKEVKDLSIQYINELIAEAIDNEDYEKAASLKLILDKLNK